MQIQSVGNQSFKGLQCHPNYREVEYILATKLGGHGFDKADKCLDMLAKNNTNAEVYLGGDMLKPKIYAEVGGKLFKESWLWGPVTTLKRALKLSNKLDAQK